MTLALSLKAITESLSIVYSFVDLIFFKRDIGSSTPSIIKRPLKK